MKKGNPIRKRRRRPMTVARALLETKVEACGGITAAVGELFDNHGLRISIPTFQNWIKGWSAPNGNPSISECGRFLEAPQREYVNRWLGLDSDAWWWELLSKEHLKGVTKREPEELLGLRPPEGL